MLSLGVFGQEYWQGGHDVGGSFNPQTFSYYYEFRPSYNHECWTDAIFDPVTWIINMMETGKDHIPITFSSQSLLIKHDVVRQTSCQSNFYHSPAVYHFSFHRDPSALSINTLRYILEYINLFMNN